MANLGRRRTDDPYYRVDELRRMLTRKSLRERITEYFAAWWKRSVCDEFPWDEDM